MNTSTKGKQSTQYTKQGTVETRPIR